MDTNQQIEGLVKVAQHWVRPERVLLVEDEHSLRARFKVEERGWLVEFVEASTGPEALNILAEDSELAMAWIDLRLPGMPGMDVFRYIRKMKRFIPVGIMSGFITDDILREGRSIGFATYIQKPDDFNSETFAEIFQTFRFKRRPTQPQEK